MQFVVDRDEHSLRGPDREHELDDLRAVLTRDGDARAGRTESTDRGGEPQNPIPELSPRTALAFTEIQRAAVAETCRGLVEQCEQVQRGTHSDVRAKSDRYFVELQPPSTTIVCPLMKLPPSEHRNATVLAMSSTLPSRGYGVISVLILRNRSSSRRVATIGVSVTPGATALQRMPSGPYWQAICVVNAVNPPLAAE